jgi:hypothetical protein
VDKARKAAFAKKLVSVIVSIGAGQTRKNRRTLNASIRQKRGLGLQRVGLRRMKIRQHILKQNHELTGKTNEHDCVPIIPEMRSNVS